MTTKGPSRHLSWTELACRDAAETPYPKEWCNGRALILGEVFEHIREVLGNKPLVNRRPKHLSLIHISEPTRPY